jgi:sodium-dependent dicarboxylate transporter 2/3/5
MEGQQHEKEKHLHSLPGTLSPTEERFERYRRTIGLFLGPGVAVLLFLLPLPGLTSKAHTLAAIIGWIVVWWMTEPIPIPISALFGAVLCVLCGVASAPQALRAFAEPPIFLFLGSFILAKAMTVHALDKRFAYRILSITWVGNSTARMLFVYGLVAAFSSMWISNTAATAVLLPIGLGMIATLADMIAAKTGQAVDPTRLRFGTGMMLMAAYASSVGGIGTPVGTPPNLIGIALLDTLVGVKIPFFQWMLFAVPLWGLMFMVLFCLLYVSHPPEMRHIAGSAAYVQRELAKLGPWTPGQRNTLIAFLVAVVLWVLPGGIAMVYGTASPAVQAYNARMPEATAVLLAVTVLFVMPVNWQQRQFTLTWQQAVRIDWGTLLLFGGGLTLGNLMFETKLAEAIGAGLLQYSGANSVWGITFAAILIAIVVSETTSNTASANMVVPVMISLATAAGLNPVPPAIGATLGASWGFMLPVSTPPNAIVYGSGMIPITRMIRVGVLFDIAGALLLWLGLRLLLPLLGLA